MKPAGVVLTMTEAVYSSHCIVLLPLKMVLKYSVFLQQANIHNEKLEVLAYCFIVKANYVAAFIVEKCHFPFMHPGSCSLHLVVPTHKLFKMLMQS